MARKKAAQDDLSGDLLSAKPGASPSWRLVSNHLNFSYMLAAGLLMGPQGFGGKHYADSLSRYPGWILLFRDEAPASEGEYARHENPATLKACVATLELSSLEGPARLLAENGEWRDSELQGDVPAALAADDIALLVRAPLPIHLVRTLSFASAEDREAFKSGALELSNVDLTALSLTVDKSLFSPNRNVILPLPASCPEANRPPALGQAIGGILSMLFHVANRSDLGVEVFKTACGEENARLADVSGNDPVLAELGHWLKNRRCSDQANLPARLFWGVVDAIIEARQTASPLRPIDQTLAFLEARLGALEDTQYHARLGRLLEDMRQAIGFTASTVTELLERHKGSLSRPLLLFCLRETCGELLEFSHPLLRETEFLLSAILFGAREGWLGMPRALRRPESLQPMIAHRMAEIEQEQAPAPVRLRHAPARPRPLRERFARDEKGLWSKKQQEAALELARVCKWTDCLQTRVSLDKGDYRLIVGGSKLEIVLEGEVKAVTTETDPEKFLERIGAFSAAGIDPKTEQAAREALGE
jgi:hypothetical protein